MIIRKLHSVYLKSVFLKFLNVIKCPQCHQYNYNILILLISSNVAYKKRVIRNTIGTLFNVAYVFNSGQQNEKTSHRSI